MFIYLILLFVLAYWAEKNPRSRWVNHPWVYTLGLAIYCTAWTYYGSVGLATRSGLQFLSIYLGPVIAMPLWIVVTKKVIYLTKSYNIASIADFISLRYGNSRMLGAWVTLISLIALIPYISLQLKAISESFQILTGFEALNHKILWKDHTFYIALVLAVFSAFYGTLSPDASNRKTGITFTVAVESVVKLSFFLIIGIYIVFYLFDGMPDIYEKVQELPTYDFNEASLFGLDWTMMIALSFIAMMLLPRQFQMAVIEYTHRSQMKNAIWGFPLYLILFNVFVIFIAWAGLIYFGDSLNPDYFMLYLPISQGNTVLATLIFIGGFSAVISMVVVATVALSTMVSNNVIIPYGFLKQLSTSNARDNKKQIRNIRRIIIFSLIFIAYFLYINLKTELPLISIGLISFLIIAQLAPTFFIGLYWNRGSSLGAKMGMLGGISVLTYTLLVPFVIEMMGYSSDFINEGLFGLEILKPYALFGLDIFSPIPNAFYWSMLVNVSLYLLFSISFKGNYRERNYGEMFVNSVEVSGMQENAFVWKGEAYFEDIEEILVRFLGEKRANRAIAIFRRKYNVSAEEKMADARFINFSEKLLTGTIGSASARILIGSVVKEKPVSLVEVLNILEENKEARTANKVLKTQSEKLIKLTDELKIANDELIKQDKQKDSFLDTVAHELKTPITAIQAASEVLQDEEMPSDLKQQFLQNIINDTQRLTKLINNILDLEKLTSGREQLNLKIINFSQIIQDAITIVRLLAERKGIKIIFKTEKQHLIQGDKDMLIQVLTNLLGNALKFVPENTGIIKINLYDNEQNLRCEIEDNGKGIAPADFPYIFDKFYQSQNQHLKKPVGSGFGLAICKQIIEMHQGTIRAEEGRKQGANFMLTIPKYLKK